MQSFKKYMTFKKDFNELILHLLRGLVKDALHFKEILSGSTSNLAYIDVTVAELQSKVLKKCALKLVLFGLYTSFYCNVDVMKT